MGENSARTVREIADLRDRIDTNLDALGEFLPPRDEIAQRVVVAAVGGVVAILTLWFLGHRMKVNRQERRIKRLVQEAVRELNDR